MIRTTPQRVTDARIDQLANKTGPVSELWEEVAIARELQERRKASAEPIYQCEFCHTDAAGDLQWHWEDVNKDFYDQYDSGRRGHRRVLYAAPQLSPKVPEEITDDLAEQHLMGDSWADSFPGGCRAAMLQQLVSGSDGGRG